MSESIAAWLGHLPPVLQLVIWGVALLAAAACCGSKARPIYQSGR